MITDVFYKRYKFPILYADKVPGSTQALLRQAVLIVIDDVGPILPNRDQVFENAHRRLARELGVGFLADGDTYEDRCVFFIGEAFDLWNDNHGSADWFFKLRLSLVELLFREMESYSRSSASTVDAIAWWRVWTKRRKPDVCVGNEAFLKTALKAVEELNVRFQQAHAPWRYHNGMIQRSSDDLTADEIEKPFWRLLCDQKWTNVDAEMKEAVDRRDSGRPDATFYALKALESVVKVISDERGWTRGKEAGAAAYVDNLVSQKNGRFIDVWEAEAMKLLFRDVRNPKGHGAGGSTPIVLSDHQSTFVIESAMCWIKSLIRRF